MKYIYLIAALCLLPFATFAVDPITGNQILCETSNTLLSDATPGGTWSSSNTAVATINSGGLVTGITGGTATISYIETSGTATMTVTVLALPHLSSPLLNSICDSTIFNYTPASTESGVLFAWSRAAVAGIFEAASSGTDNPNEQLINITHSPVVVEYVYTLTTMTACVNTNTVAVTVNPSIRLNSALTSAICSGDMFNYTPSSLTVGATYVWTRNAVTGIAPASTAGTGNISETLSDTITTPVTVAYKFKLSANGCTAKTPEYVNVTVYPLPCKLAVPPQSVAVPSSVYPNPTTGNLIAYIASPVSETVTISIMNMVGAKVKEVTAATNTATDISLDVPAGMYILTATGNEVKYYTKIVVAK